MKFTRLKAPLSFALLFLVGNCSQPIQPDQILIGEFGSLSGPSATYGISTQNGIQVALEEINDAGGIAADGKAKRKISILKLDDRGNAAEAQAAATQLITQNRVVALLGEVASSRSLAAAAVAQKYGIPMISPSSTNSMVTEVGDYIFRVCFIDSFQGRAMAGFAKKKGLIKVATLVDQASPYSAGLAEEFRSAYKDAGHEIVIEETYMEGDQDFLRQLTEISAKEPDAVFIPGYYPEVGRIAKQVSEMNMNVTLLGGDAWDSPELLTISKGKFPTAFFTNHYLPDVSYPENKTFVESYTKYGKPDAFAALAYDAAKVLFNAINRAGSTAPEKIRDELARTQNFRGATGLISINPSSRNAEKEVVFVMVKPACTKDCFKEAR